MRGDDQSAGADRQQIADNIRRAYSAILKLSVILEAVINPPTLIVVEFPPTALG